MSVTVSDRPEPSPPVLSIVTPAYREQANLPALYQRLRDIFDSSDISWEWIVVDDCSPDQTFAVAKELAANDARVRVFGLSRNFGSHAAIVCGMRNAEGDVIAVLAGDLQDPPEALPMMLEKWRAGASIVWAVGSRRAGQGAAAIVAARLYYWVMRHVVGLKTIPPDGADFVLVGRPVAEIIKSTEARNISIFALLAWVGFKQDSVSYEKQPRLHGETGWTLKKKLKLLVDSVTAFSYFPIRFMSWLGLCMALLGFVYAVWVIVNALIGTPAEGWASLMVVVLVIGGFLMTMLGVLGEYIWRNLDEARQRPIYIIERRIDARETPLTSSDASRGSEAIRS